jgi:lysylphosphatidylglycerol synthetase-like protein (DUF2156 family)
MAIRELRTAADPLLRAVLIFTVLAVGLLSLEGWAQHHRSLQWAAQVMLGLPAPARPPIALAVAATALYLATRPKRAFRRILVALAVAVAWLSLGSGRQGLVVVALLDAAVAMLASSLWTEESDPVSSRLGWSLLGVALPLSGLSAWLLLAAHRAPHPVPVFTIPLAVAFLAAVGGFALLDRNPPLPARQDAEAARRLYRDRGRSGVAPFALMRDKAHFWAAERDAFVAFGCSTGVAMALGPPIGPAGAARRLNDEFRHACRRRGWRPAWYQVSEADAAALPGAMRLPVGREALVDVARFSLDGRAMANLRHQVTKAGRLGVSVEVREAADVPRAVRSAMRALADELAAGSSLGEMAFSVGRRDDPADVERSVALAYADGGGLAGYATWLWVPAAGAVVLDEVKRAPFAPSGTVELLIERSLTEFRGRAGVASLGIAPIVGVGTALIARTLGVRSASAGLGAFKAKFRPAWEPRYLVVERPVDVPAVLLAVLLLHHPALLARSRGRSAVPRALIR